MSFSRQENLRLAIIADIHGNLSALRAILRDIDHLANAQIICLGDVASFGPQPRETLERIRALGCPVVMGNTDDWLLKPRTIADVANPNKDTPFFLDVESWSAAQLSATDLDFIRGFQPAIELSLGTYSLLAFHGSPRSYNEGIFATTPDEDLEAYFAKQSAQIMTGGHTHAQLLRRFQDIIFFNPGSVGLPYENVRGQNKAHNPPWAEYALLEIIGGQPCVSFRRAPYDVAELIRAARASGMPHVETWLAGWLH